MWQYNLIRDFGYQKAKNPPFRFNKAMMFSRFDFIIPAGVEFDRWVSVCRVMAGNRDKPAHRFQLAIHVVVSSCSATR
jgi:hypothetical protein